MRGNVGMWGSRVAVAAVFGVAALVVAGRAFGLGPLQPGESTGSQQDPPAVAAAAVDPIVGYDISWPQCPTGALPPGRGTIGIVGVNGGRPYNYNECFRYQWDWARNNTDRQGVYINTGAVRSQTEDAMHGPAGDCWPGDPWCQAYNWGYNNARLAHEYTKAWGAYPSEWWLDVETMNVWTQDKGINARNISGAIDYLVGQGFRVGVYSTPYQWGVIAGWYAPASPTGDYWFVGGLGVWTAGASGLAGAMARCDNPKYEFAGGKVTMVQYVETFDTNYICPNSQPRPPRAWISRLSNDQ